MEELNKNLRYLIMPAYVYEDNRLSPIQIKIYCFIHSFRGEFFAFSNEHLANMFKCDPQSISNAIQKLEELKYIKTEYRVKAGGGKVRLAVDLYSDYNSSYSRPQKNVPTTITTLIDNDINDNNLIDKNLENQFLEENPAFQMLQKRKVKKTLKTPFGYNRPIQVQRPQFEDKPAKNGAHGEDVV